jgi:hypothetical protein
MIRLIRQVVQPKHKIKLYSLIQLIYSKAEEPKFNKNRGSADVIKITPVQIKLHVH